MSQLWLKFLERIGSPLRTRPALTDVHDPTLASQGLWHEFSAYDVLFQLYGPPKNSPWYPYHCPTLFAAIDRLRMQPRLTELSPEVTAPQPEQAWQWLAEDTLVLLELNGGLSVQMGARLLIEAGAQLVSTFDHWPMANRERAINQTSYLSMEALAWPPQHVRGNVAIDSRDVMDSMVSMAPEVHRRTLAGIAATAPAVWMFDSRRLVASKPGPGDFDNRYYIDDSILPSAPMLARHGIRKLVYFSHSPDSNPSSDLTVMINQCQQAGMSLLNVALSEPATWVEPLPMAAPPEVRLSGLFFPKTQIGGFGRKVPEPSESSGGSFSGGGG